MSYFYYDLFGTCPYNGGTTNGTNYLSSCELYDPAIPLAYAANWKQTKALTTARGFQGCCNIPDLKPYVLAIGGKSSGANYLTSIEEYDIGLGYIPEWQSSITNYKSVTHISDPMNIQGLLFRGVTEADGGNHCHIVNSDHPIISLLRIPGGNWQSNGGGEALYMPYSTYWDTANTVVHPTTADSGYCMMWAIVNAIPTKWYKDCAGNEESLPPKPQSLISTILVSPNPTTQVANIQYYVSGKSNVSIKVYDAVGRVVKPLIEETKEAGTYSINLNTKTFTPGIYFVKLSLIDENGRKIESTKKLILTTD